jgi:tetratricopeptide (TPR) repeat protein
MLKLFLTISLFLGSFQVRAANFGVPAEVKQKYKYLYSEPMQATPDGGMKFHKGRLFLRYGVRVLSLEGDRFEMAFQHGRLLADVIPKGAVPQSSVAVENAVRNGFPAIPLVTGIVIRSFYRRITEGMFHYAVANAGANAEKVLLDAYGLSEGSQVPVETLLYGALGPESLQVLLGERTPNPAAAFSSQCSEFAAWGSRTSDGEVLIGRNTDYPLNGSYDHYPTVFYFNPTSGGQKIMSVASAGIHNAGVVGMNESGIYIGVHSIPATDVSPNGVPAFFIAQEVLRESKSLDEALAMFKKANSPSGWAYQVVSFREKRAATLEISNHHHGVFPATGEYHIQTNHYRAEETKPYYLHVNEAVDQDTYGRYKRIFDLIEGSSTPLNEKKAAAILGDKVDPLSGKVRGLGNTVAVHTTMTSVVVEAGKRRLWVASGHAPVSVGDYVEFPMLGAFSADTFAGSSYGTFSNRAFADQYPALAQAEQKFIEAKIAYESELDYNKAHRAMEEVLRLDGGNPSYQFVAAILALKAGERAKAVAALSRLKSLDDKHLAFVARYYLARLAADQGDKRRAKSLLASLLADLGRGEAKLREATGAAISACGRMRAYRLPTQSLGLMVQQADMLAY